MTQYSFREMQLAETKSMLRYFINADLDSLHGMGVDPAKLPSEEDWFELLREDFSRPRQQRHFYYVVWKITGVPVGHCNINKIEFGEAAQPLRKPNMKSVHRTFVELPSQVRKVKQMSEYIFDGHRCAKE